MHDAGTLTVGLARENRIGGVMRRGHVDLPLIGPASGRQLHLMTFNLLFDHEPPPRTWQERLPRVLRILEAEQPTVLGTQELLFPQVKDLKRSLPGYDYIYLSCKGGARGLSTAVFFETSRLEPLSFRHLWLSRTPHLLASRSWGNEQPRMMTWVRFADARSGREFVYVNTHFDHLSENSRLRSAELVKKVVAYFDVPVMVGGDFNTPHHAETHERLINSGLVDSWDAAAYRVTDSFQTFNDWRPKPRNGGRIDWILTTPEVTTHRVGINAWTDNGAFPSDHWPVQALVSLE